MFSSETSVGFQRTTRRYIPEDRTHHNHRCENLKSHTGDVRLDIVSSLSSAAMEERTSEDTEKQQIIKETWKYPITMLH
jgi:hypothetical protein